MRRKRAKANNDDVDWAQPVGFLRRTDLSARTALNEPEISEPDAEKIREFMKC